MAQASTRALSGLPPAAPERRSLETFGLFAGVGGIELGLQRAGHPSRGLCELDPAAKAVLARQFPGIPVARDVETLKRIPRSVDLVTAGFPCQDLSQVGSRLGLDGGRSGLVREVFRLLAGCSARFVLLENVPFMLRLGGGAAMKFIMDELERLGYRWAYRVVDARAFGLPQRRERVLILGSRDEDPRSILLGDDVGPPAARVSEERMACGFYWTEGARGLGWVEGGIPTLKGTSGFGIPSPPAIVLRDGNVVIPGIRDAERLQGLPRGWTAPASTVDPSKGTRWRLVNNAVPVPVAEWIGRRLALMPQQFSSELETIALTTPLPRAGWNVGNGRVASTASAFPIRRSSVPIEMVLKEATPLSRRATAGFLSRLESGKIGTPDWFRIALRRHIEAQTRREAVSL